MTAKEQEDNSQQRLGDGNLDEEAATGGKFETEEDTVAIEKQEGKENTSLQPLCVDNVVNKTSEILAGAAAVTAASPEGEKPDHESAEKEQEAESVKEEETAEEDDGAVVTGDAEAEATAVAETLEIKEEPSNRQEVLDLEEAPVDEKKGGQEGKSEDAAKAENTEEIAAETDMTNEHKVEISENNDGGLIQNEEAEEITQEKKGKEEESSGKPIETDDEMEKESEEFIQEQDNPIKYQEVTDVRVEDKEEVVENEQDVSELNVGESVAEDRAERSSSKSNKDTSAGRAQESGDTEKDEDGKSTTAQTKTEDQDEGAGADEEQLDEVEPEEKDEMQTEVESEKVATDMMAEGEADKSSETANIDVENIREDNEAVNTASETTAETPTVAVEASMENRDVEVDVESGNGEMHDDQEQPSPGGEVEVIRAGVAVGEVHAEVPAPVEPTDRQGTTVEGTDKRGGNEAELPSLADVLETMATQEDKSDGRQEGSVVDKLEVEKPLGEIKVDNNHEGEANQDENGNVSRKQKSDSMNRDRDAESNIAGLRDALSETPGGTGSGEDASKFNEPLNMHEADKRLDSDTIATELPTSKGETEDVEEVSKTSEEGASVLVKPQDQTSPPKNVTPVLVANEGNVDLVSNWVNTHQASRFFETFVEPLDDLKEPDPQESPVTKSGERSASPVKEVTTSEQFGSRKEPTAESTGSELESSRSKDDQQGDPVEDLLQVQDEQQEANITPEGDTDGQQNGQELVEDLLQAQVEPEKGEEMPKADNDKVPTDKDLVEDLLQMQKEFNEVDLTLDAPKECQTNARDIVKELLEEQEVDLLLEADNAGAATENYLAGDPLQDLEKADEAQKGDKDVDMMAEERSNSRMSQREHSDASKTEVESFGGTQRSIHSDTPERVSCLQTDKKITESTIDLSLKQREVELPESGLEPETNDHQGWSRSSENLSEMKQSALVQNISIPSEEVPEITDLTTGGNHEETHQDFQDQTHSETPGDGIVRDVRLIEDIQRTLSKDRLSPFTVDATLLGQNSYPMLSAMRPDSKH